MRFRVVPVSLHEDASVCKGMLLRHASGRVKHLATKQLWAQSAIEACSIAFCNIPRCHNAADMLTHSVSHAELAASMTAMGLLSSLIFTSSSRRWRGTSRWREECRRMTTKCTVSCLREPCTGEPHPHGNDAQVAVRLLGAR